MLYSYMLMYQRTSESVWNRDGYFGEATVRADANRLFREGFESIRLYKRTRAGWMLVKGIQQDAETAACKRTAHFNSLIPDGCTIIYNTEA